jgi:Tfp pilus assembly protein PilX
MHGLGTIKKINRIADAKAKHQLAQEQRDSVAKPGETELEQRNREAAENGHTCYDSGDQSATAPAQVK